MGSKSNQPPLIVIVGQTASGKTALALELAKQFGGEIIAADSRTVYKGMTIGTAKPSIADQQAVPHHLLDIVSPNERFTVVDFKQRALKAIDEIAQRDNVPFLVGGTGLYVDAVIYDFSFREKVSILDPVVSKRTVEELQALLNERSIPFPENKRNPRHLIRQLETGGAVPTKSSLRSNTVILGLQVEVNTLRQRIVARVEDMVAAGLVAEVRHLTSAYGWGVPALQAPGYKELRPYPEGLISLDEAKQQIVRAHYQYARRQKTWFKRNPEINWISKPEEAVEIVTSLLNK